MKLAVLCLLFGFVSVSQGATLHIDLNAELAKELGKLDVYVKGQLKDPKSIMSQLKGAIDNLVSWWSKLSEAERKKIIADATKVVQDTWKTLQASAADINKQLADPKSPLRKKIDEFIASILKWFTSPEAKKIFEAAKAQVEAFLASPTGKKLMEEGGKLLKQGSDFFNSPEGKKVIDQTVKALSTLAG